MNKIKYHLPHSQYTDLGSSCSNQYYEHCFFQFRLKSHLKIASTIDNKFLFLNYNPPSLDFSYPSGFMLGSRWILVVSNNWVILLSVPYLSQRYLINNSSISLPTTSFPCMLATYLNSGLPVIWEQEKIRNHFEHVFLFAKIVFIYFSNFLVCGFKQLFLMWWWSIIEQWLQYLPGVCLKGVLLTTNTHISLPSTVFPIEYMWVIFA